MAQTAIEQLVTWLDDAHAMETGLVGILQSHASHFTEFPGAADRIRRHVTETEQHARRLEQCLAQLGAAPSGVKSTLSSLMGTIEGASTVMFRDRLAKDVLADYAAEQFEVACYTALVSVALRLGYTDVARLCEDNLREDMAMAEWLLEQVPDVVSFEVLKA
jgi:ferritin-like metal-binding protein YciE